MDEGLFAPIVQPYIVPPFEFAPEDIEVRPSSIAAIRTGQGRMGKGAGVWKPSPGRNLPFTVHIQNRMVGLLLLSSPVLNLRERDSFLALPKDPSERGTALRGYMDLAVAIGAQPLSWYWNLGKLIAMVAPTLGPEFTAKYGDELLGITSTSLWGKSSQYNRIYQFLGYTAGNGVMHIPAGERDKMRAWLQENRPGLKPERRGVMEVVKLYIKESGDKTWSTFHGQQRGIYYHAAIKDPRESVIAAWFERWGHPRWLRTKDQQAPYDNGTDWHKRKLTG